MEADGLGLSLGYFVVVVVVLDYTVHLIDSVHCLYFQQNLGLVETFDLVQKVEGVAETVGALYSKVNSAGR